MSPKGRNSNLIKQNQTELLIQFINNQPSLSRKAVIPRKGRNSGRS
jgi:hypothetical protein